MANFGKIYGGTKLDNSVIAYTADHVLQDMKVSYPDGIPADLVAGSVVSLSSGAMATSTDNIGVVVSPSVAGQKFLRVARTPFAMLIKEALIVDSFLTLDEVVAALTAQGFAFTDYAEVALRTT